MGCLISATRTGWSCSSMPSASTLPSCLPSELKTGWPTGARLALAVGGARSNCAAGATTTRATASVAAIASAASRVRKRRMEIRSNAHAATAACGRSRKLCPTGARAEIGINAHVLGHALAQRPDGIGTHGELLSEVDNTSILRARRLITDHLSIACRAPDQLPRSAYRASDLVRWP